MPQADPLPQSTERLTLRHLCEGDLGAFQAYRLDPIVGQYQGWSPTSDDAARDFLIEMSFAVPFSPGQWFQIGIADRESDMILGDIGILVSLDSTDVQRVVAITDSRNNASMKLLIAIGMEQTGTVESTFRGQACIEHVYTLGRPRAA